MKIKLFYFVLIMIILNCAVFISGCSRNDPQKIKTETDNQVYNIIDKKWEDGFGPKSNYKIVDEKDKPAASQADMYRSSVSDGLLTIPEAVFLATAYNPDYLSQKDALYVKALDLKLTRHDFENRYFGLTGVEYAADRNDEVVGARTGLGLSRLMAAGGTITTNVTVAWADVLSGNLRNGLGSVFSAAITQPLLRGSDRKIVQENLTQAERDTLYQIRFFGRFRQEFAVSVISQYYRVLQQNNILKNAQSNYDVLCSVYDNAEKLSQAGRLPEFELDRARQDKFKAEEFLVQQKKLYQQMLDKFKITLNVSPAENFQLDAKEFDFLLQNPFKDPSYSETEAIDNALILRLDLANSSGAIEDAVRKVVVAEDSLGADLNLVAGVDIASTKSSDLDRLKATRDSSRLGLEFSPPLERSLEQNLYIKSLIDLSRRKREYEQAEKQVTLEVRQAYRDLKQSAESFHIQSQALALAKERSKNTFLLLQYGRASTKDVLDAQDDLLKAQNASSAALTDYTVATLKFYRDTGILQILPDGMLKSM
ncbi:MAG: TolC family protein [Candidatus Brocadiia bacterium]|nr:MAG: TolC family protein [Candidatus Brocadiia bacterium]